MTRAGIGFLLCASLLHADTSPRPRTVYAPTIGVIAKFNSGHDGYRMCGFTSGSQRFVTAGHRGEVYTWSLGRKKRQAEFDLKRGRLYALGVSGDGRYIVASTRTPRSVTVWDTQRDQQADVMENVGNVRSIAVSAGGDRYAFSENYMRLRVRTFAGKDVQDLSDGVFRPYSVALSMDGSRVAAGGLDRSVRVWDVESGDELHTLQGHMNYATLLVFSPGGSLLATASRDRKTKVWDLKRGEERFELETGRRYITALTFSPDGKFLLGGDSGGTLYVWRASNGEEVRKIEGEHFGTVTGIWFSADRSWLITVDTGGTIRAWGNRGK